MASSKEFRDYVLEQCGLLKTVTARSMMGGYLFYYNGKLFGGIYDDRFLIKITESGKKMLSDRQALPYKGAKNMLLVEDLDDMEFVATLVTKTCSELPDIKK